MKIIVLFFCFFGSFSNAQSSLPKNVNDSLWGIWNNSALNDTSRLSALDVLIWDGYLYSKPDSAIYYSKVMHAFAVEKKLPDFEGLGLTNQGIGFYVKGDYKSALKLFNEGLVIYERIQHKEYIATTLNKIGNIYKNTGEYSLALDFYNRSLDILTKEGLKSGMSTALNNIGSVYMYQGDFPRALDYYLKSLLLAQEVGNQKNIGNAVGNIGIVYKNMGDLDKANEYYLMGLKIQEEIGDNKGYATSLNNIGANYKIQGDWDKALEYFHKSLRFQQEYGNKQALAYSFMNIGIVYTLQLRFDTALVCCMESMKIQESIGDKRGMSSSIGNIAYIYKQIGDNENALIYALKALELAESIGIAHEITMTTRVLYQFYLWKKDFLKAKHYLVKLKNQKLSSIEKNYFGLTEREKELFFVALEEDFMRYYEFALIYQKLEPELTDTAYNLALTNKGLALKSSTFIRQTIIDSGDSTLIHQYEEWRLLKQKISKLYSTGKPTKVLEEKADSLEKILVVNSAAFSDFKKVQNVDWKQVQAGLNQEDAAIEFVHYLRESDETFKTNYAALIVTATCEHPIMVNLCRQMELIEILGVLQGTNLDFINSVYGTKKNAQSALYEKIWKPMEIHLEGIKNIYLSPSGLLHKISFAALAKEDNVYLCDLYDIHQQSSTGKIVLPENSNLDKEDFFTLIGGVQYSSSNSKKEIWEYLPGTLKETDNIKSILKKKNIRHDYFYGELASEELFKKNSSKANILHIATHGYFYSDPDKIEDELVTESEAELVFRGSNSNYAAWNFVKNKNPLMRSGIILANSNDIWDRDPMNENEDGILTAAEVSNMDLHKTKLVVLSACETGLGDIKGSEGVYGLQRAFKMAGVKFIIMSLWQVPDEETAEFMTLFYKRLIKVKDIHIAFDQTQKAMRAKYDPYYWAAFVLIE